MTNAAALFTAKTQPVLFQAQPPSASVPMGGMDGSGAISGGLLRPGSIDQATFLQLLQQQQQNRAAAGVGGKAVAMPPQSFQPAGIPTLTSAQFAALVGAQNADQDLAASPAEGAASDPQAAAQVQGQVQAQAAPVAPALKLSGATKLVTAQAGNPPKAGNVFTDAARIARAGGEQTAALESPAGGELPSISRKSAPVLEAAASASTEPEAAEEEDKSKTASKADPNVVHLKSPPDKDQQKELRMRNKRWVVDETPGARQLFFGADGEFGWDDFLDVINPLQHIPGIAQIYRAITGDEINGAANLIGAIPFGPLGGVALIGSVADLAVKDTTGKDIGGNLQAMVFGDGAKPEAGTTVPDNMADADPVKGNVVRASARQTAYVQSDASAMHESCRG